MKNPPGIHWTDHICFPCGCEFAYDSEDERSVLDACTSHLSPGQLDALKQKLTIIGGLAQLMEGDPAVGPFTESRARTINRTLREISAVMGWTAQATEVRQAVVVARNPDAHLGSEGVE